MLRNPWIEWYKARHESRSLEAGQAFEDYVTHALRLHHADFFINPTPTGSDGDGGCDGLARDGKLFYACYGSRATTNQQSRLISKMASDLARAIEVWPDFEDWLFVTNVPLGTNATKWVAETRAKWNGEHRRKVAINVWTPNELWTRVVRDLSSQDLDELHPGVPGARNVQLEDLVPLIDVLAGTPPLPFATSVISAVSQYKLDYNELHPSTLLEFNEGRVLAPIIDGWFDRNALPTLRDNVAEVFRGIYRDIALATQDPRGRVERCYIAIGGSDFRVDGTRANAAYAITAYFFDACDIFEEPPPGWRPE